MKCPYCSTKFEFKIDVVDTNLVVPIPKAPKRPLGGDRVFQIGIIWCKKCNKVISCTAVPEDTIEEF